MSKRAREEDPSSTETAQQRLKLDIATDTLLSSSFSAATATATSVAIIVTPPAPLIHGSVVASDSNHSSSSSSSQSSSSSVALPIAAATTSATESVMQSMQIETKDNKQSTAPTLTTASEEKKSIGGENKEEKKKKKEEEKEGEEDDDPVGKMPERRATMNGSDMGFWLNATPFGGVRRAVLNSMGLERIKKTKEMKRGTEEEPNVIRRGQIELDRRWPNTYRVEVPRPAFRRVKGMPPVGNQTDAIAINIKTGKVKTIDAKFLAKIAKQKVPRDYEHFFYYYWQVRSEAKAWDSPEGLLIPATENDIDIISITDVDLEFKKHEREIWTRYEEWLVGFWEDGSHEKWEARWRALLKEEITDGRLPASFDIDQFLSFRVSEDRKQLMVEARASNALLREVTAEVNAAPIILPPFIPPPQELTLCTITSKIFDSFWNNFAPVSKFDALRIFLGLKEPDENEDEERFQFYLQNERVMGAVVEAHYLNQSPRRRVTVGPIRAADEQFRRLPDIPFIGEKARHQLTSPDMPGLHLLHLSSQNPDTVNNPNKRGCSRNTPPTFFRTPCQFKHHVFKPTTLTAVRDVGVDHYIYNIPKDEKFMDQTLPLVCGVVAQFGEWYWRDGGDEKSAAAARKFIGVVNSLGGKQFNPDEILARRAHVSAHRVAAARFFDTNPVYKKARAEVDWDDIPAPPRPPQRRIYHETTATATATAATAASSSSSSAATMGSRTN